MDVTEECRISQILDLNYAWAVPKDTTKRGKQNALRQIKEEVREMTKAIKENDDVELLDSICDTIWTCCGMAYRLGFNLEGALDEVYYSNHSKLLLGDQLNTENAEAEIKRLEENGKENVRVVEADYGDITDDPESIRTGSLQDKHNKVQKPSWFVSPDLLAFVNDPELRKQALDELTQLSQDNGEPNE